MLSGISQRKYNDIDGLPENWPACLKRVMAARGIHSVDDITLPLKSLPKPEQMLGMDSAVKLLVEALSNNWHIMIVADFDSDGATSCAVAMRGLRMMGVKQVSCIVPNRFIHGYGLTPELIDEIPVEQQPDLLLTVDNGIASIEGVEVAHDRGMKVLVTDHHLPGEILPKADAIINPNQKGDCFPDKNLAGVGVCFYLLLGLRTYLREHNWFEQQKIAEPKLVALLDLVALGTVADVVPLDRLNRTFVTLGLQRIRNGLACAGIKALIQGAGCREIALVATDLGFSIAPRINAAGRLEDMSLGINALITDSDTEAMEYALLLDNINQQRKQVEQTMQDQAQLMLAQMQLSTTEKPLGYCLFDKSWNQGVIGLLASRIKEAKHRPVIAFAPGEEGEIKGSARSIPGVHIRDVLALIASQAPEILSRFGGHAMAAGLTISHDDLDQFKKLFLATLKKMVDPDMLKQTLFSDGELTAEEICLPVAELLAKAAPWGQSFPEPQFHGVFYVENWRHVGQQQDHLRLILRHPQRTELITAIAFRQKKPDWLVEEETVLIHYKLSVNEFRNTRSCQFLIDNILPVK